MRVYIDTETTGLDPVMHMAYEVAWAGEDQEPRRLILPHTTSSADPTALEIGRYYERGIQYELWASQREVGEMHASLQGNTLVGANPSFDRAFLSDVFRRHGLEPHPWHHRSIDVEVLAMMVLEESKPLGLRDSVTRINDLYEAGIPLPDHTAVGDVLTTRGLLHFVEDWRRAAV